jgi:hypothetical protein
VSDVVCRIALSEGKWEIQPSKHGVRELLRSIFPPSEDDEVPPDSPTLTRLRFEEPEEDEILVAKATVRNCQRHNEIVRDDIIQALLAEFQPEYESMVEVEVCE